MLWRRAVAGTPNAGTDTYPPASFRTPGAAATRILDTEPLLNVTTGYVSQLERGANRPTGLALAMLNTIKRKGIEAIL